MILISYISESQSVTDIRILAEPRFTVGYRIGCANILLLLKYFANSSVFFSSPIMIGMIWLWESIVYPIDFNPLLNCSIFSHKLILFFSLFVKNLVSAKSAKNPGKADV